MSTSGVQPSTAPQPARARSRSLRRIAWLAVAAVAVVAGVLAATASRPPATESERAYELKQNTLCPVCDGQSVLESNAPAAAAMRRQIDLWVDEGRTDTQIRADLAAAYGDDVNALPPGEGVGTLVWALPVAAFAVASAGLWAAARRWRARAGALEDEDVGDAASVGAQRQRRGRTAGILTVSALVVVGVAAGLLVARSAGLRLGGETLSGDIDRSARSLLVDAQRQFAANQLDAARATLEEISRLDRDLRGALVLSARLHLRRCELLLQDPSGSSEAAESECDLLSGLVDLDRVLAENPGDTEALALRGWMLVSVLDDQLVTLLDADLPDRTEIERVRELIFAGIASLDAAVDLDPGEFDPWIFRGYAARYLEGDLEAAIGYYGTALERNPPPAMADALEKAIAEMRGELE